MSCKQRKNVLWYCGYVVSKKGTITVDISQSVSLLPSKYDAIINLGCKIGITESATFLENVVRTSANSTYLLFP